MIRFFLRLFHFFFALLVIHLSIIVISTCVNCTYRPYNCGRVQNHLRLKPCQFNYIINEPRDWYVASAFSIDDWADCIEYRMLCRTIRRRHRCSWCWISYRTNPMLNTELFIISTYIINSFASNLYQFFFSG